MLFPGGAFTRRIASDSICAPASPQISMHVSVFAPSSGTMPSLVNSGNEVHVLNPAATNLGVVGVDHVFGGTAFALQPASLSAKIEE
jgi:hypothetical protein